jgi:hypothetical protein
VLLEASGDEGVMKEDVYYDPDMPLSEARVTFRNNLSGCGTHCPCCGKFAKEYVRRLNYTMVRSLLWLTKKSIELGKEFWVRVPKLGPRYVVLSNQLPTCRYWGLIEAFPKKKGENSTGVWRPTQDGVDFVFNQIGLYEKVIEYRSIILGYTGAVISVDSSLGGFDYEELMNTNADSLFRDLDPDDVVD